MFEINEMRKSLERKKGRHLELKRRIVKIKRDIRNVQRNLDASQEALIVIQIIARKTQNHLEYHLSDLASAGMAAVFADPYELEVEFNTKRNQVETDMWFTRDGRRFNPKKCGGGARDIAALTLQFSIAAIQSSKTRPLMLLDEPLKWLKGRDLPRLGSQMIKEISEKLDPPLQIIMVSHSPELIKSADKVFKVKMNGKYSEVEHVK